MEPTPSALSLSKVEELRPCIRGYALQLKVLDSKPVQFHGRSGAGGGYRGKNQGQPRIAECIVGDNTGVVVFTAWNNQDQDGRRRVLGPAACCCRSPLLVATSSIRAIEAIITGSRPNPVPTSQIPADQDERRRVLGPAVVVRS